MRKVGRVCWTTSALESVSYTIRFTGTRFQHPFSIRLAAQRNLLYTESVGFEPTVEDHSTPVFKTGAIIHSANFPKVWSYHATPRTMAV